MTTYLLGFIVCEYALWTGAVRDDKRKTIPVSEQLMAAVVITSISLFWPIVLAVWMRDLKETKAL